MRDALRERWRGDLTRLRSPSGNVDLPGLVASWAGDAVWMQELRAMPRVERLKRLAGLGVEAYDRDEGNFAAELRWNAAGLGGFDGRFDGEIGLEEVLRRHAGLLVASLADSLEFQGGGDVADVAEAAARASLAGLEHLEAALAAGRGALLLGVYQTHPGYLLFHPRLAGLRLAALQHSDRRAHHRPVPLTADGRVSLLPASVAALRPVLHILESGGCVVFYNDYLAPGATPIRSRLFGRPVVTSRAILSLAFRSGAAVVPFAVARQWPPERDEVRVELFRPLLLPQPDSGAPSPHEAAAHLLGVAAECLIRRHPAPWRLWNSLRHRWAEAEAL